MTDAGDKAPSEVTYLGNLDGNRARELADRIDAGDVTHVVMAYRMQSGDLKFNLVGDEDLTFLIGMISRVQTHLHCEELIAETWELGEP